ncbi:MAG: OPT/YSL family transporter, partial [Elusimicrobiota bacterium]
GNIAANMTASGTTGTIAVESEALMQDYKAGLIIGSSPKYMTFAQLLGVPVGAAAVSWMYPLLRSTYGIGGEKGLSSPISVKWAGFAELLSKGISSIPTSALWALVIFTALGILLTILEQKWKKWIPSPTGVGIGMLVPGIYIVTMFLGGLIDDVWRRKAPKQAEQHSTPLASGLIAGEAIVAVVVPLLILTGILSAN